MKTSEERYLKHRILESFFIISVIIIALCFSLPAQVLAKGPLIEISPKKVKPGDAFLIRVSGVRTSQVPHATLAGKEFHFTDYGKGRFVAVGAVDVETKPRAYTVKVKIGKKKRNLRLTVKKARFPKQKLSLPEEIVSPSPEDIGRIEREREKLQSIFRTISDRLWAGGFIMPLENKLSTKFGSKRTMNGKYITVHKGVDIAGCKGEEIRAANTGKVVLAEDLFLGGNTVILDHGRGIFTIYMHMSEIKVAPEDVVSKGNVIGSVGSTGRSSGPHLHFGVKVSDISVNPVSIWYLNL